jgi:hypothetical protein
MRRAWLFAIAAFVATPAAAQQYQYVARTEAPATRQGAVTAGLLTWQCQGSACTIGGPWPRPAAAACAQLAREVGRIVSYGRQGSMLDAAGLATCNAGLAAAAPVRLPPRVVTGGPLITVQPRPQPTQPAATPSGPIAVTTPELSFVVNVEAAPRAAAVTVNVTAPELSFIVDAEATPTAPPETVAVTTPELSFVVR